MDVVVHAGVAGVDDVGDVGGFHEVAVGKGLGDQLFGLAEGGGGVGVVADHQDGHVPAVEGALEGVGGELVIEQAGARELGVNEV